MFLKAFNFEFDTRQSLDTDQRILFESTEKEKRPENTFEIYQPETLSKAIVSVETKAAFHMQNGEFGCRNSLMQFLCKCCSFLTDSFSHVLLFIFYGLFSYRIQKGLPNFVET